MSKQISYLKGDATNPVIPGNKIIVHICNDIGAWGKGFVLAVSKRWSEPEKEYKKWHKDGTNFELGEVQFVQVSVLGGGNHLKRFLIEENVYLDTLFHDFLKHPCKLFVCKT